jgi:hypothetical protein
MSLPFPQSKNQLLAAVDNLTYSQRYKYPFVAHFFTQSRAFPQKYHTLHTHTCPNHVFISLSMYTFHYFFYNCSYASRIGCDHKDKPALRVLVNDLLKVEHKERKREERAVILSLICFFFFFFLWGYLFIYTQHPDPPVPEMDAEEGFTEILPAQRTSISKYPSNKYI